MESLKKAGKKLKGKAEGGVFGFIENMLKNIDFVEELLKEVRGWVQKNKPIKVGITTKKGMLLEATFLGFREDALWITVKGFPKEEAEPDEEAKEEEENEGTTEGS